MKSTMRLQCPKCQEITLVEDDHSALDFACLRCGVTLVPLSHDAAASSSAITADQPTSVNARGEVVANGQGVTKEVTRAPQPFRVFGRFQVRPYQAEGGLNAAGVLLVMILEIASGLVLGVIASLVSRLFYLILFFPLAIGLGTGMAGALGVQWGKVRNRAVTALIGFLGGCGAMFAMHYCDYLFFRSKVPGEVAPHLGFFDYIDATAEVGVSITHSPVGKGGTNLGYIGTYIYYLVEIFIVAGVSLAVVTVAASKPYCSRCNNWKKKYYLGHLDNPPDHAAQSVRLGELQALQPSKGTSSLVRLFVHVCPDCRGEGAIDVLVQQVSRNEKNEEQVTALVHATYPPEALAAFQQLYPAVDFAQ
jgi:hypothetical protein